MISNSLQAHNTLIVDIRRITAIWAFSEAAFGGILHILKIPFAGIFIGGAAVIFISLIGRYSNDKSAILRSTLLVILVKAVVSPYSPLASYLAIAMQGFIGYILFSYIKNVKVSTVLLGFLSLFLSSLQKLFVLTILFGFTLWEAIDSFVYYIAYQLHIYQYFATFSISIFMIILYCGIHISAGIYIGIKAYSIPEWLEKRTDLVYPLYSSFYYSMDRFKNKKKKKPRLYWWQKPSGIIILILSILFVFLSYYSREFYLLTILSKTLYYDIILMLVRSLLITFIWFSIISPFIQNYFNKFLDKNKFNYAPEINKITALFPSIKRIINYAWFMSDKHIGLGRIKIFLADSVALLLTADIEEEPYNHNDKTE